MSDPYGQQPYGQPAGYGQQPYGAAPVPSGDQRPGTVTAAAWIAIVFSGLIGLLFGGIALVSLAARDEVIAELERQPEYQNLDVDLDQAFGVGMALMLGIAVWCVIAVVLAVFVLRRSSVARILLVISSAVAATLALLGIMSGVSIIPLVACLATIVLLFVGGAGAWFKRVPQNAAAYPGGYGGYQPYGAPQDPQAGQQPGPYGGYGEQPQQQAPQQAPQQGADYPNPYGNPYGTPQGDQPSSSPNPYGQVPPTHQDPDNPSEQDGQDYPPRDYPGR
ncbi:hypothetical protein J2X46_000935 [Nocardioides sp. BE266]|uniref:hypothetical protein n=1 Tax=Nocardioides sp. BE266 TaxID=2817725 RepID=UPI00285A8E29|nr:hypothetical protein [Nocardioides sp. BE266]MDR7251959.1 hypothetical protein [Nocardioides sp. BE266]